MKHGKVTIPQTKEEFEEINRRRHELIDKRFDVGLSRAEEVELTYIKERVRAYVNALSGEALHRFGD